MIHTIYPIDSNNHFMGDIVSHVQTRSSKSPIPPQDPDSRQTTSDPTDRDSTTPSWSSEAGMALVREDRAMARSKELPSNDVVIR